MAPDTTPAGFGAARLARSGRSPNRLRPCREPPANGIEIEYDTFGEPADPALLLVMGFTAQMTAWDEALCKLLADRGLFVIRFDNRDCGLSTKLDGVPVDLGTVMAKSMAARSCRRCPTR